MVNRVEAEKIGLGHHFPDDPLIKATKENNIAEIKRLLSTREGDPNCVTWAYRQGLHCYVQSHEALNLIIDAGLVIDEKTLVDFLKGVNETDFTCEVLQRLIEDGAPVNGNPRSTAENFHKTWPILDVMAWGRTRYIETLLQHGADPNRRFVPEELTALHFLVGRWDENCCTSTSDEDSFAIYRRVCEILLDYGADIHARDRKGRTPVLKAGEDFSAPALEYLVSRGACLLDVDHKGNGVLALAESSLSSINVRHTQERYCDLVLTYHECFEKYYVIDKVTGEYIRVI